MSPSIIPQSRTPARSHNFSTARDQFSPGASRPNTMTRTIDLEVIVKAWIDTLNSPLSTSYERISILNDIEKTLVRITDPSRTIGLVGLDQAATFWALQATVGYSLAEVLLAHVFRLHIDLVRENEVGHALESSLRPTGSSITLESLQASSSPKRQGRLPGTPSNHLATKPSLSEAQQQRIHLTVSEICIAITILQGLTLCSKASKRITQRKSSLELLLQIVLADYCTQLLPPILCPAPTASTSTTPSFPLSHSPSTPSPSSPSKTPLKSNDAPLSLPSGFALDLLMCILVDSDLARERFSDMGGIQQIVQLSHKCADTVTTPASTPTSATGPTFAETAARSSDIIALKQTDLLCLEFRYFWSQVLQGEQNRRSSLDVHSAATSFYTVDEGSTATPRASPKKRASKADLKQEKMGDTPKAARRRVAAPTTARATSEEAPSRPSFSRAETGAAGTRSPRKLRYSASVAELHQKPSLPTKSSVSPVPLLPTAASPDSCQQPGALTSRRHRQPQRPSTSASQSSPPLAAVSSRERKEGERARQSTVSETARTTTEHPNERVSKFNPSRPGMSSRDRPRIPSPLKPRTPAQEASEVEEALREKELEARQQAIPYHRLRSSMTNTPFEQRDARSREVVPLNNADVENRNPFSTAMVDVLRGKERLRHGDNAASVSEVVRTPTSASHSAMSSAPSAVFGSSESRSHLGSARIPPSPAVRRAQLARARSLSPTKLSLGAVTTAPSSSERIAL